MDEINVAANSSEVATPEIEVTTENPGEVQPEVKQDVTETQVFAKRLKEATSKAEQAAMDKVIAEIYGDSHGFKTYAEYQKALQEYQRQQQIEQDAQKMNADPELVKYVKSLEEKVSTIENQTKAEKEAAERAVIEKEIQDQVKEVLDLSKKDGMELTEEKLLEFAVKEGIPDLKKAYKLMKPEIDIEKVKQDGIKEYIEKLRTGKVPVEGSGSAPAIVSETPKTFDDARKGAAAILRAANMFK